MTQVLKFVVFQVVAWRVYCLHWELWLKMCRREQREAHYIRGSLNIAVQSQIIAITTFISLYQNSSNVLMAFYKPISRWTRNRRTHSALNKLVDDLQQSCNAHETELSEDGSSDLNSVVDSHSHQTYETHSVASTGMNSSLASNTTTVNFDDQENGCHFASESDADVSISYMSDDETGAYSADVETKLWTGSVYESDSDMEELNLVDDIAQWAIQFNISHSALRSLLQLLRKCHPDLPKDPRTVLQTCTAVSALTIAGGSYYHFGLAN